MNILHSSNTYSERFGGGIHEAVFHLANVLTTNGHHSSVAFPASCGDGNVSGGRASPYPIHGPISWAYSSGVFSGLKDAYHRQSFDIIHQHGIWTYMSLFSLKAQTMLGIPRLVQPHGLLNPHRLSSGRIVKTLALLSYERLSLKYASGLIACSDTEAQILKDRFPGKNIGIIPNGVPDLFFKAPSFKKPAKTIGKRNLLFLSQIIPVKGLERFFYAIHQVGSTFREKWHVRVAGYGDPRYISSLKELADRLDLSEVIDFVGPVYGDDKLKEYDNCDAFILPTFDENFGIAVAEALARGKPVVTTKGAPWSVLEDISAGIWANNTDRGIVDSIISLTNLTDTQLTQMGQNGRKYAEAQLRWQNLSCKYLQFYEFVLMGGSKPDFVF